MSKLPLGWVESKLKDIFDTTSGGTPNRGVSAYYGGDIPWLKSGELNDGIIFSAEEYITNEGLQNSSAKLFPKGSLLIALYGATVGKLGILNFDSTTNQAICCIYQHENYNKYFLFYYLLNHKKYLIKQGKGGAQSNINQEIIKNLIIPLPPLNEQRRIVEKIEEEFGKIDEGVEKLRFALEQIKQYRQAVLKSAFDGKLYKTTEWEEKTLGQILTPRRERITPNKHNGELPFIGMDCIMPNSLKIHNSYKLKDTKSVAFVFYKNDVLYGRMRSYLNKVWQATFDGASSAEFIVFPENKQITSGFLKYLLHQQTFVKYATRNASGDRPRVKFEADLAEYKIKLPKIDEQNLIVEKIENAFSIVEDLNKIIRQNIDKAEQLKQSILKKAFEGRLVPQDPNDEPASVLLEKIKAERKNK